MRFLDLIRKGRQEQAKSRVEQWRGLILRAATKDNLTEAEALLLDDLHRDCGGGLDLVGTVADVREHGRLSPLAARLEAARRDVAAAEGKVSEFDAQTQKLEAEHKRAMEQRAAARAKLMEPVATARQSADQAEAAGESRENIEAKCWRYFDRPDPAIAEARAAQRRSEAARTRHIHFGEYPVSAHPTHPVVFADLRIFGKCRNDVNRSEFIWEPFNGQTQQDVEALISLCERAGAGEKFRFFLTRSRAWNTKLAASESVFIEDVRSEGGRFDPSPFSFIPHPDGQDPKDVERYLAEAQKLRAKYSEIPAMQRA